MAEGDGVVNDASLLIYDVQNGIRVELMALNGHQNVWATQAQIAAIFNCSLSNVSEHIQHIYQIKELLELETLRNFRNVSNQPVKHYNLDIIISVGYRVNSVRATQFRIWATKTLKEYLTKGFAIDDEKLKNPQRNLYFNELLERIREIRASEKLFYQQVKEIYATAIDYQEKKSEQDVRIFFATIQNKLLYAVTGKTAAELIVDRANISDQNFGLTNWEGSIPRKKDICIAKNYLSQYEFDLLKSLVNQLLEYLEGQTIKNQAITIAEWQEKTNKLIKINDYNILQNPEYISHKNMEKVAIERYEEFDQNRKTKQLNESQQEALLDMQRIYKEVHEYLNNSRK